MSDKDAITRNFSRYAGFYDRYAGVQSLAAAELAADLPTAGVFNILEIGCGTGNYTSLLRERFASAAITATDISDAMIDVAGKKPVLRDVRFIAADADALYPEGCFDLVTSNAVFQWLDDMDIASAKCEKSLSDKGVFLFSYFGPATFSELRQSLKDVLGRDILIGASRFLDKPGLEGMLDKRFAGSSVREEILKYRYGTLMDLLNSIKYTGTRGRGFGDAFMWTKSLLKETEEAYLRKFGVIEASYQVFFCKGVK